MQLELDKLALFEHLGYHPHAGQVLVHQSKARCRVLACGSRWGKSTAAIYECIAALLEPRAECIGWIVAPHYQLSERIFQRVVAIIRQHFEHRLVDFRPRERKLTVLNLAGGRSSLVAKSADNRDSLLAEGIDFLVIDEATRLARAVWEEHLSQRLMDTGGWLLALSTPAGKDWFYSLYRRGQKSRDREFESWASPSWENPALNRELIEAERKRLPAEVFGEQYAAEFGGADCDVCETCGAPDPDVRKIIMLAPGEQVAMCGDCEQPVDEVGHTLVRLMPDGSVGLTVFHEPKMFLDPEPDSAATSGN